MQIPFAFKASELPKATRKSGIWIAINFLCLVGYLSFSIKYEADNYGDINTAISLGLTCLPILICVILTNIVWMILIFWRKNRPLLFIWFLIVMIWTLAVSLDHHLSTQAMNIRIADLEKEK